MTNNHLPIGIHAGIPEAVYHADPAPEPSASSSILRTLFDASPEHAREAHPRLNPAATTHLSSDAQMTGTILHALVLGTAPPWDVLDFDNYRTKAAQEARASIIASGALPILRKDFDAIAPVASHLLRRLADEHPQIHAALTDPETIPEATAIWRDRGVMCRARVDALPPARHRFIVDLKFTGRSAAPEPWSVKLRSDYLFQASLYPRAIEALRGDRPDMLFVVCETEPPYGVSVHALAPDLAAIGEWRLNAALKQWSACLAANSWPGYPRLIHWATAPAWFAAQDDERTALEHVAREMAPAFS